MSDAASAIIFTLACLWLLSPLAPLWHIYLLQVTNFTTSMTLRFLVRTLDCLVCWVTTLIAARKRLFHRRHTAVRLNPPTKTCSYSTAPAPRNMVELKSYLGLLSHYGKFLPNLSTVLVPMYQFGRFLRG